MTAQATPQKRTKPCGGISVLHPDGPDAKHNFTDPELGLCVVCPFCDVMVPERTRGSIENCRDAAGIDPPDH